MSLNQTKTTKTCQRSRTSGIRLALLDIYQLALRPLLFDVFQADPEQVHRSSLSFLAALDRSNSLWATTLKASWRQMFCLADSRLQQSLWGKNFPNPIGLAAGFDKDGVAPGIWPDLGFGFAELGTVTYHPQAGNPQPRLFRLPDDRAALNRMGFNNLGSESMAARLCDRPISPYPLGINLGKSKITPEAEAAADYAGSFERLQNCGDYFVVNVSSPNTPGLRNLQAVELLAEIITAIQKIDSQSGRPLLVKIAPDLAWEDIAAVVKLSQEMGLAGIIATNTTIAKSQLQTKILPETGNLVIDEAGGISGAPVRDRSTEVIRFIHQTSQGQLPIIGVGGVFTAQDAWDKITAGASLVQLYTGWTYEGPWTVLRILQGLLDRLEANGLEHIGQAIGYQSPPNHR
jgi:dihydroorotate dehydrogenase